jgi:hypothetical protein
MGKNLVLGALATVASVVSLNAALANVVEGTGYETTGTIASDATPASLAGVAAGAPQVTFSVSSDPLSLNPSDSSANYTLGSWLGTAGVTGTYSHGAASTDSMENTIWNFVGTVTVTTGETFSASHDDGLTLIIGGVTVIDAPGPTAAVTTTETYTGPSGNEPFQLVYGECCGAPGSLVVDLPLTSSVPEPSTWAMMLLGFAGLGFVGYRRTKKVAAA